MELCFDGETRLVSARCGGWGKSDVVHGQDGEGIMGLYKR